jgi:phosphonate C-P lyase system protein PhnG
MKELEDRRMSFAHWTEIANKAAESECQQWLERWQTKYSIDFVIRPMASLTMMTVRESVDQLDFHAGELLTTECAVLLAASAGDGADRTSQGFRQRGFGLVLGDQLVKAEFIAVLDALLRHEDNVFREEKRIVSDWLHQMHEKLLEQADEAFSHIARTKVKFSLLDDLEQEGGVQQNE